VATPDATGTLYWYEYGPRWSKGERRTESGSIPRLVWRLKQLRTMAVVHQDGVEGSACIVACSRLFDFDPLGMDPPRWSCWVERGYA
jgi:hypothetical protein